MFNQYLTDTYRYLTYTSKISLINWSLTDSNRLFNPNQYLPLFNSLLTNIYSIVTKLKQYLTGLDQYLNDSYKPFILKTGPAWIKNNGIGIHDPY